MIFSYDTMWAIKLQPHTQAFDPIKAFTDWYKPLETRAQAIDIVSTQDDLSRYPLVVAPSLNVLTQADADRLAAYVRAGGHLVLGPRTGMKDDANALWPQRQPGPLLPLLGARVEQYYALDQKVPASGDLGAATASIWAEVLAPQAADVSVIERYGKADGWLDGKPAVVARKVGKGTITYVGAWFDAATLDRLAAGALGDAHIAPILTGTPDGVEVDERSGNGRHTLVLINHNDAPAAIALPTGARPMVGDYKDGRLPAHGVAVVALANDGRRE